MTHLPTHPTLRHPRTGEPLRAIGIGKRGPIWPAIGGSEGAPPTDPPADPPKNPASPPADPPPAAPPGDEPLGAAGKKALDEERAARKALEKQLAELAPLKQVAELLGGKPSGDAKTDLEALTERLDGYERRIGEEQAARWRAEIVAEKGLKPELADRLRGGTKDELAADADALLALIPATPSGPRTPAPDPTQGSRGTPPPDLDSQIAAAQAKNDWRTVLSLQNQKLAQAKPH